jgi:hypothetical protein
VSSDLQKIIKEEQKSQSYINISAATKVISIVGTLVYMIWKGSDIMLI